MTGLQLGMYITGKPLMGLSREGIIDTPFTQIVVANAMHDNINKTLLYCACISPQP